MKQKRLNKLSHTVYECKYHIVFCPKYRFQIFKNEEIARYTDREIYILCRQKELLEVLELNVQEDHIHIVLSIPPKYAVSGVMGFLKGKLALRLFSRYEGLSKKYFGRHLWSRGYCVSTVGLDEEEIRKYVKWQHHNEKETENNKNKTQFELFDDEE